MYHHTIPYSCICMLLILVSQSSCKPKTTGIEYHIVSNNETQHKPGTHCLDTFTLIGPSIVIYSPDELQLEMIRQHTNPNIFDGLMHEYEFQIIYCKRVIQSNFSEIPLYEPKNVRYLLFEKTNKEIYQLDLNSFDDAYGIFLFNGNDKPQLADMTNFEQALQQVMYTPNLKE